jgi:tetratricopeptide (TPR) repeat protein
MTIKRQQPDRQKKVPPQALPENQTPPTPADAEPGPDDVFSAILEFATAPTQATGREEPHKAPTTRRMSGAEPPAAFRIPARRPASRRIRLSSLQKMLLLAIAIIGTVFVYAMLGHLKQGARTDFTSPPQPSQAAAEPPQPSQAVSEPPQPSQAASEPPPQPSRAASEPPPQPSHAASELPPQKTVDRVAPPVPVASQEPVPPRRQAAPRPQATATASREVPRATLRAGILPGPEPLSLQLADKLYGRRDFEHALAMYEKLADRLPATEENQPLHDLLLLRRALCHKNAGNPGQADGMFRTVSLSRLPVLRALARYHQSVILLERQRYLEAVTQAWQTIGLIEVIDYDKKWTAAVQQQCRLLVAEAMTRHVLSLRDADSDVPADLWTRHPDVEPFLEMEEPQLRVVLLAGAQKLEEAMLSPQIRTVPSPGALPRWSVICNGAPLEELLARFAARAGLNVRWADAGPSGSGPARDAAGSEDNLRRRPVYLYLASASAQEVATTAAGGVGLLARMDEKGTVLVLDPASYASLADHTKLLAEESTTLWRRTLLMDNDEQLAAHSHFALGLLHAAREQFDQAIAEYKLVANQFPKHSLAPHGLLYSGKLKVRLRDYVGAHQDLKQLVELYPEQPLSDQACLYLADATMKAGLYEEATGLYHKVYNLGLSTESQTQAALGAGYCFRETGRYEETANWLNRYVTLARDQNRPEFCAACLALGKAYLALHKPQQAQAALNLALQGELSRPQHIETVGALAKTYIEQGSFLDALRILEEASGWQLSQRESVELLLLRVQVLRSIGLVDKAITLLADKSPYLPDAELKGKVAVELGRCYRETGALELARKTLSEAFKTVEAGPLSQEIGGELAGTCLRLGQPVQAISICTQLLEHAGPADRPALLSLLAEAYRRQQKYEQAVAVLLDRHAGIIDPNNMGLRMDTTTR